jgi:CspA family cold shock protein
VARAPEPQARTTTEFGREVAGTVKFYDARKGFGFVTPDKGTVDIYVGADALKRSGLEFLQPQVRVRVFTKRGPKGVEAEKVAFL